MNIRFLFFIAWLSLVSVNDAKAQMKEKKNERDLPLPVQYANLACHLIRYGYQTKSAMPLILAVQLFQRGSMTCDTIATKVEGSSSPDNSIQKETIISFEEKHIIEDATIYASDNVNMLNLITDLQTQTQTRGVLPDKDKDAQRRVIDRVGAHSTDIWRVRLHGGKLTYIMISGDGDTDLDAYVYDQDDILVADDSWFDGGTLRFTPRWTSDYTIKIVNRGNVFNFYTMIIRQQN